MKPLLALLALALPGCVLVPDSIRPEVEHMSHVSQHFGSSTTNYGANTVELMAHWDVTRFGYFEVGEGLAVNRADGYTDRGAPVYGEIEGPREQFLARAGVIIPLK